MDDHAPPIYQAEAPHLGAKRHAELASPWRFTWAEPSLQNFYERCLQQQQQHEEATSNQYLFNGPHQAIAVCVHDTRCTFLKTSESK